MRIIQCEQGSPEWRAARLGIPSASSFDRIITPAGKPSGQATAYRNKLIAERLLGRPMDELGGRQDDVNRVKHGCEWESRAADKLEQAIGRRLQRVGFITTDDGLFGCSPDRLVEGENVAVEIKAPSPGVQISYLLDGPGEAYRAQVQGQLWVGDFDRGYFYSWHPWMPPVLVVTYRDEAYLAKMVPLLHRFVDELERETERARSLGVYEITDEWPEEGAALRALEHSAMQ